LNYYLAIDIGASSGRHILGRIEDGRLLLEEVYRFTNAPDKSANGDLTWDVRALFNHILEGLKACRKAGKIPVSVGIDTWGVDYVLLDKSDSEILPAYCYRDNRTAPFLDTAVPFADMYAKTGIQRQPFNTVYQLLADKAAGRLAGAESMLMLPEYFSYKLTGIKAREYTNATTTGLVGALARAWDSELIDKLRLPQKLFAPLFEPGKALGGFSKAVEKAVGFNCNVILPASHDTASAVAAVPDGAAVFISSGTWSLLGILTDPILSDAARLANYTNEGAVGGKVRFLRNITGLWIIQRIRRETGDKYSFAELAEMAASESGFDYNMDVNAPRFLSPPSMIKAVEEQCREQNLPVPNGIGGLAHCVYNSLARSYADAITELEKITGKRYGAVCVVGGGSNNDYLNRLTAVHTRRRVLAGPGEATAAGNILVQYRADPNRKADGGAFSGIISKSFDIKEYKADV
jgi:rhamnulokinase